MEMESASSELRFCMTMFFVAILDFLQILSVKDKFYQDTLHE